MRIQKPEIANDRTQKPKIESPRSTTRQAPFSTRTAPRLLGVIVPPVPIRLAITRFQLRVIGVGAMIFGLPAAVWFPLGRTPNVIVAMRGVVIACVNRTSCKDYRTE